MTETFERSRALDTAIDQLTQVRPQKKGGEILARLGGLRTCGHSEGAARS